MKNHLSILKSLGLSAIVVIAAVSCETTTPPAGPSSSKSVSVQEGVPGGVIVNTVEYTGKVTYIDRDARVVTILRADNTKAQIKAGPEVKNLDKINAGDLLKATVIEETIVYLHEGTTAPPDTAAAAVLVAPKGGQPGAISAGTVRVTGTVTTIDYTARTATLTFEDGTKKTFPVRRDIDLTKQRLGSKVTIQVTELIAITVDKPEQK